jgi:D-citramalate synthase
MYFNDLLPNVLAEGENTHWEKTSGKANIEKNLQELGLQLNPKILNLSHNELLN